MKVRDVFDSTVVTATPHESASTAWDRIQKRRADHLVVVEDGRVVGVVSRHDLSGPAGGAHRRMGRRVVDLMHSRVFVVSPSTSVARAAALMQRRRVGCLPVVERKRLVGILTVWRLLSLLERT